MVPQVTGKAGGELERGSGDRRWGRAFAWGCCDDGVPLCADWSRAVGLRQRGCWDCGSSASHSFPRVHISYVPWQSFLLSPGRGQHQLGKGLEGRDLSVYRREQVRGSQTRLESSELSTAQQARHCPRQSGLHWVEYQERHQHINMINVEDTLIALIWSSHALDYQMSPVKIYKNHVSIKPNDDKTMKQGGCGDTAL